MSMYKLYGRPGSGSLAVQVALEEAQAPFERLWVGPDEPQVEAFRAINPTGKVPALVLPDGTPMFESAAMLIYLAAAHPRAQLAPAPGSSRHAVFLQWMVFLSANLYESALRMYYAARYSTRGEADAEVIRQQGAADFSTHLGFISDRLAPYVLGSEYSVADTYLYMLASWHKMDKVQVHARWPKLAAHAKLLSQRAAIAKVEADHAA